MLPLQTAKKNRPSQERSACTVTERFDTTLAAQRYFTAQMNATGQVAYGTLLKIMTDIEAEYRLDTGTMQPVKIYSRVRRNNLTGVNQYKTPPFFQMRSRCLPQFASNWNESEHHSPHQI